MRNAEDEPLPVALWLSELADLSERCANAAPGQEDRLVRRAFHLSRLSSPPIRALAGRRLEESCFESALENDGPEAAARLVAGERATFAFLPAGARFAAEISYGEEPIAKGEGSSRPYAMIGAWANFLGTAS